MFSWISDVCSSVVGQIMSQVTNIEDQITSPIRSLIQQVTNGIWVGKGADAFVDEMNSQVLPAIANLVASLSGFGGGINQAGGLFEDLENAIGGIFDGIGDFFSSIF